MNYKGTRPKRFGNLITISSQELQDFIKNQTPIVKKTNIKEFWLLLFKKYPSVKPRIKHPIIFVMKVE